MKTPRFSLIVLFSGILATTACSKDDDPITPAQPVSVPTLTADEKAGLLQMREEEKLARDVYIYAYDKWGKTNFDHISSSEQTHMDQVLDLLKKYGLKDPASNERGVFNDPNLQTLYNSLTAKVDISLLDAQIVGATIEDLDIFDLNVLSEKTTKKDLLKVFESLTCGSRNHMRAFYGQVQTEGGTYTAQYISQAELEAIINSSKESCN